ncbi:hypothetical protein NEA10_17885 [Phormidium yuhuli AB48]|uniref:Uncharacterized protein n=1 Tax=Phormidium yuhuli AB48 TaxID=2940671 RepID=A0ABY5AN87_9CYAN|nr:hypothetical protein [Phormidium yuhuli]USR90672.1 hypothetical protein NEA10_17885 [Phormidium yuhuli AB48]
MSDSSKSRLLPAQATEISEFESFPAAASPSPESVSQESSGRNPLQQRLQDWEMRYRPLEVALVELAALRQPRLLEGTLKRLRKTPQMLKPESPVEGLTAPEAVESGDGPSYSDALNMEDVDRAIAQKQEQLDNLFWHWVPPALADRRDWSSVIEEMGDRQLRQEAQMQRGAMASLMEQLPSNLHRSEVDVLSSEAQALLGTLLDIERRQRLIEGLVRRDRTVPAAVLTFSMLYGVSVMALVVLFVIFWSHGVVVQGVSQQTLPLIGLPWPVLVWSLFGSLSAIVARCLYAPFRRLGEMSQWMLLRPIQGVVLGGACYFILQTLLSLLIPLQPETPLQMTDEAILLLSFVVGFSDRLARGVFGWLSQWEPQNR